MITHAPIPRFSRERARDGPNDWPRDRPHGREWLATVFHCRATETGGIIRRQIVDVEREVGCLAFEAEVQERGFRLIRTRHHYVIVCDPGPINILF